MHDHKYAPARGNLSHLFIAVLMLPFVLANVGCAPVGGSPAPPASAAQPGGRAERYELRGVVKSVDKAKKRATISHEKIGDYMEPITMPFAVKDERALGEMKPGQRIKATLVVTDDNRQWLENITLSANSEGAD